jgi:ubiquinone/menaquinone biosynthesis C-methylase UbiE
MSRTTADYTTVTETPGDGLRREALEMLWTRYTFAADRCRGRDVLEIACGAGQGLGLLEKTARRVVGGDYTERLLQQAHAHYDGRVSLVRLDAHWLPVGDRSFDVVILFEAVYYLEDPGRFVRECRRVLRPGGRVLLCTANKAVTDFNPSPFSHAYFSGAELVELFRAEGFVPVLLGAFPAEARSRRDVVVSLIKRAAVALRLVPRTMKGKAVLKRVFFGPLQPAPPELAGDPPGSCPPEVIGPDCTPDRYRVLFVDATLA